MFVDFTPTELVDRLNAEVVTAKGGVPLGLSRDNETAAGHSIKLVRCAAVK